MLKQVAAGQRAQFVATIMNRARALFEEGQLDGAEVLFATLVEEPSVRPLVQHMRGLIAMQLGQNQRARQFLGEAIAANPADAVAHANLGVLLLQERQHPQALAAYAAAVGLQPHNAGALLGLANALAALGFADLAEDAYRETLTRHPDHADALRELGLLLKDLGARAEAVAVLRDAVARHPLRPDLHTALGFVLFAAGDWAEAWTEYEWRWQDPAVKEKLPVDRSRWQGEDFGGKTLLLQCEQGFGDTLQFVRYVPLAKARGGRVILRVPRALLAVAQSLEGVDRLVATDEEIPTSDATAPLLSLPKVFGTRPDNVPAAVPYLHADAALAGTWGRRLGAGPGVSVGLCWQGNPAHPKDHLRSIGLSALRPLLECPGVRFVSLQVGPGQDQLKGFDDRIVDPSAEIAIESFADAAAIIANLDLVISVDSAVAHLAGALGKPVWILLAAHADWRWMPGRDDTAWYPRAQLFRQSKLGQWDDVVARVGDALWRLAGAGAPPSDQIIAGSALRLALQRTAPDPLVCDALFMEGVRHHRADDVARSRKLFERALSLDPDHVNALCNLGAVESGVGNHARARVLLERAVALAPRLVPARLALAECLLASGDADMAVAHYREALGRAPNRDAAHAGLAMALRVAGDLDGAMVHFERAVRISQRQSAAFYEALGLTLVARENLPGAEVAFRHAVALDPKRATAHCGLGNVCLRQGRASDAAACYRQAIAIDPACAAALRGLAPLRVPEAAGAE